MNENRDPDLCDLTLITAALCLDHEFVRPNASGEDIVLRLEAAESVRRDPTATEESDRPFSLLFRGPLEPCLTQGMHDLQHPTLPLPGIFLVPIGGDDSGRLYEAIFS